MTLYWKTLTLDQLNSLTIDEYNSLELEEVIRMADIVVVDTGNAINNGSIILSIAGKSYITEESEVVNTPEIADISGLYETRWTGINYY